jgi:GDP-4-dehydro-6-deoxy-D-mannose reductase
VPVTVTVDPARYRPSDNLVLWGDRSRIERELGWKPEIPLDQTLADLLDYWRKEVQ